MKKFLNRFIFALICSSMLSSTAFADACINQKDKDGNPISELTEGVIISSSDIDENAVLISALYDKNNKLVSLVYCYGSEDGAEISIKVPENHTGYSLETMIWDDIAIGQPLCENIILR